MNHEQCHPPCCRFRPVRSMSRLVSFERKHAGAIDGSECKPPAYYIPGTCPHLSTPHSIYEYFELRTYVHTAVLDSRARVDNQPQPPPPPLPPPARAGRCRASRLTDALPALPAQKRCMALALMLFLRRRCWKYLK